MPSSPSRWSSESSNSPAPTRRKRPVEDESSDNFDDHDAWEADSEDAPQQALPATEVTVLSHAERRRQKKKQKQHLASVPESPRKRRKLDDGTSSGVDPKVKPTITNKAKATSTPATDDPRLQKRQNSVWVGNLSFRTTQDALRAFFDGVGTITRIHMPMRRGNQVKGENMGFAYVDFDTSDAKVIAITLSEGQLDGRNLLIKDGADFAGRPAKAKAALLDEVNGGEGEKAVMGESLSKTAQKILRLQKQPPAPTLFLGNLGFETTEESIRELFEAHRNWSYKGKGKGPEKEEDHEEDNGGDGATSKDAWIRKIRMGTFEDSGACKGFAFVDFTSIGHATDVLVNPRNHRLNGRDLVVEYASPDAVRRGGGGLRPKGDRDPKSKSGSGKALRKGSANAPYAKQRQPRHAEQEDGTEAARTPEASTKTPRSRGTNRTGHDRSYTHRTKPGAALAHAQRQSVAIMPSQGQKIVF